MSRLEQFREIMVEYMRDKNEITSKYIKQKLIAEENISGQVFQDFEVESKIIVNELNEYIRGMENQYTYAFDVTNCPYCSLFNSSYNKEVCLGCPINDNDNCLQFNSRYKRATLAVGGLPRKQIKFIKKELYDLAIVTVEKIKDIS